MVNQGMLLKMPRCCSSSSSSSDRRRCEKASLEKGAKKRKASIVVWSAHPQVEAGPIVEDTLPPTVAGPSNVNSTHLGDKCNHLSALVSGLLNKLNQRQMSGGTTLLT